jgi:hypothetical protein
VRLLKVIQNDFVTGRKAAVSNNISGDTGPSKCQCTGHQTGCLKLSDVRCNFINVYCYWECFRRRRKIPRSDY